MFGSLKPRIDLRMVASVFGISSHFNYMPLPNPARLRPEGNGYIIDVNNANSVQRQRFSIVHEIGHKALLDHGIRITKHRGSVAYTDEEHEEEEICDAIGTAILGLRREVIRAYLSATGFTFKTIEHVGSEHNTSFEATLRAFLRYCDFPAAGAYCEMHGGLVAGIANHFIVRRAYHSSSFTPIITADHIFSYVTCLRDGMRQQGKIASIVGTVAVGDRARLVQAKAKRMTIYVGEQPKLGVVLLIRDV